MDGLELYLGWTPHIWVLHERGMMICSRSHTTRRVNRLWRGHSSHILSRAPKDGDKTRNHTTVYVLMYCKSKHPRHYRYLIRLDNTLICK